MNYLPTTKTTIAAACLATFLVSFWFTSQEEGSNTDDDLINVSVGELHLAHRYGHDLPKSRSSFGLSSADSDQSRRDSTSDNGHKGSSKDASKNKAEKWFYDGPIFQAIEEMSAAPQPVQGEVCHESDCEHLLNAQSKLEQEYLNRKTFEARLHPRLITQSIEDLKNYKGDGEESFRGFFAAFELSLYEKSVIEGEVHFPKIEEREPLGVLVTDEMQFVFYDGFALRPGSFLNRDQEILAIREDGMDLEDVTTNEVTTINFKPYYLKMMLVGEKGIPTGFSVPIMSIEELTSNWGRDQKTSLRPRPKQGDTTLKSVSNP